MSSGRSGDGSPGTSIHYRIPPSTVSLVPSGKGKSPSPKPGEKDKKKEDAMMSCDMTEQKKPVNEQVSYLIYRIPLSLLFSLLSVDCLPAGGGRERGRRKTEEGRGKKGRGGRGSPINWEDGEE